MRDSFIFYRSFYEALEDLPAKEFKSAALAIFNYALNGVEPTTKGIEKTVFRIAKDLIDRNNQRYENGKKGGRPRNQTETEQKPNNNQTEAEREPNKNQNATNSQPNDNPNVDVDVMMINNNINTTHARAREVSVDEFEQTVECEGWEHYPGGEVYIELRDTLVDLINDGEAALEDVDHRMFGALLNAMYDGRERRKIIDLRAYCLTAIRNYKSGEVSNERLSR